MPRRILFLGGRLGRGAVVAVVDSGVCWTHSDIANQIWVNPGEDLNADGVVMDAADMNGVDDDGNGFVDDIRGWDFVSVDVSQVAEGEDPGPPDNDPVDFHGHGTHVSGIAGAVGNNGIGVAGVNWNVSLMGLRVCWANPSGYGLCGIVEIAGALAYAADNGADIVNMSFGSPYPSHTEREAIDYCAGAGVLLVAAAGNSSSDAPHYPAAFDNVMAVAALNGSLARASFSNYGPWVDIAAPGESIYSTLAGGGYGPMAGTSMASPIVAGAAGMVKAYHPAWSSEAIARQLRATAIDLNSVNPYFVNLLGTGLAAVDDALLVTDPRARLGIVALRAVEPISTADGALDPGEMFLALDMSLRFRGDMHAGTILVGDYHNGPLSILIPLGIYGMIAFVWFLVAGLRVLHRNWKFGNPDYRTVNGYLLAAFAANAIFFFVGFGSISDDLHTFVGLLGLGVALNGAVPSPREQAEQPAADLELNTEYVKAWRGTG